MLKESQNLTSLFEHSSEQFEQALEEHDINLIKKCPKTDLHNHFVLGGNRSYIEAQTGVHIEPIKMPLHSMKEMDSWNARYIGSRFNSKKMRKLLIDATFVQAQADGVSVLEIGEDVWGLGEFFNNDIDELIRTFIESKQSFAPNIQLRLQIGLSRHCPIHYLEKCLESFWGNEAFYSMDLYGDEFAQPIENFVPIYTRAKREGIRLKAHVGEWGSATDIRRAVELLELDEVQHGISAVKDESVMRFLADHHIRLNITPSSNIMLGRVKDMRRHPIAQLYHNGVSVTINSDDILMFDSDVSKEYLRLYESKCLTAAELNSIRLNALD